LDLLNSGRRARSSIEALQVHGKNRGGQWWGAYVLFPFDVETEFGVKGRVPIRASINGIPYAGSLSNCGGRRHVLGVLKSIRNQLEAKIADEIEIEVWKDDTTRTVDVPAELLQALRANGALGQFENLSYTHRKEYCRLINEAKTEQTRARRGRERCRASEQ
jgi:hypothetical protein